jgi:very-short-patch-repair endonuclease
VAITRARRNVKLVSSIMPEDIDLTRTQSLGAQRLRDYMLYARDGVTSLRGAHASRERSRAAAEPQKRDEAISRDAQEIASQTALAMTVSESPFEEAVYQALTAQGLTLHKQVGVSNYRIDLGVADPQQPGRYLLGIECDGAMYAAAPTARERDRLRQQVLEQLGWKMHRIWSHDWISNQTAEIEKVLARLNEPAPVLEARVTAGVSAPPSDREDAVREQTAEAFLAKAETPEEVKDLPTYVWPYIYTKLPPATGALSKAVPHDLVGDVIKIVGTEGPVHVALVYERIGDAWRVSRLTAKVKELINTAIGIALHDQRLEQRAEFLWPIGLAAPVVRAPKEGDKGRSIEHIAPEEIAEAAFLVAQEARSINEADLISQTAKLLGHARVTKKIDAAVTAALEMLKASGRVVETEGLIRVV